jgi:CHAT domain/SIR2-like domain
MKPTADLEIGLHRWDADNYAVELRFRRPEDDSDISPVRGYTQFDLTKLRELTRNVNAYGTLLTNTLFRDKEILNNFESIHKIAQGYMTLRLRLFIGPTAPELHSVRWETLLDPLDPLSERRLATDENVLFSRYMSSSDWRPVRRRPRSNIQALVAIANPSDIESYQPNGRPLTSINVAGELERAKASLKDIPITPLTDKVTLRNIAARLREREYDILYLVCHGAFMEGKTRLYLEGDDGSVAAASGEELVNTLSNLQSRPSLVILASCQSAGNANGGRSSGDGGVLAALGPRLAGVGIPAVLAMQGDVTMTSIEKFMPKFFEVLREHGQVDRAVAAARGEIQDRPDSWVPVLFMRLESGRIWSEPGFSGGDGKFSRWATLVRDISKGLCTPILGSGLLESFVGSSRETARRWAKTYHFPMSPFHREDLPQVAQYVSVKERDDVLREELVREMLKEITLRYRDSLPAELNGTGRVNDEQVTEVPEDLKGTDAAKLIEAMTLVGRQRCAGHGAAADGGGRQPLRDQHRILAHMPFKVIITTNPDELLVDALKEAGKAPKVELCRWKNVLVNDQRDEIEWPRSYVEAEPNYEPTERRPLVYYLFGYLRCLDSLVLTEDNYFDYLIGITKNKDTHPSTVRKALSSTALLFLGFQLDDWDFRVLFRSLMAQEGRRKGFTHVAVQIDPEEGRIIDPDRARRYLQKYFGDVDIDIYWGSVDDFIRDLKTEWNERRGESPIP